MASNIKETLEVNIKLNQSSFKQIETIASNVASLFSNASTTVQNDLATMASNVSNSMSSMNNSAKVNSDSVIENVSAIASNIETLDLAIKKTSEGNPFGGLKTSVTETSDTIMQKFDGAYSAISDVIATASKFKPFEEAIKKNEVAITAFSLAMKSAKVIVEIVNLFKGASTIITAMSGAEQIATVSTTILTGAVSALKIMMGGLVVGAIAALIVGLISLTQKVDENVTRLQDQREAMQKTRDAMKEMNDASQIEFADNSNGIDVQQRYLDALMSNIDAEGNYIGEKEKLAFWLDELNKSYPNLQLSYDEESGKIMAQNGLLSENIGLVEDLIKSKRVQAYLDAYQDDYVESLKNQKNSIDDLAIAQAELNALKEKEANGTLTRSEEKQKGELELNVEKIKSDIQAYGEAMTQYEEIAMQYANKDYEGATNTIYGGSIQLYDPEKGQEQIDALREQAETVKAQLDALVQNVAEDPAMADSLSDKIEALTAQYEASKEQLALAQDNYNQTMEVEKDETAPKLAQEYTDNYSEAAVTGMQAAGDKSAAAFESTSKAYIGGIVYPDKIVRIVAQYENFGTTGNYGNTGPWGIGASFDDSQEVDQKGLIQPFSSRSALGISRSMINGLQRRVISTIKVGIPRPNLVLDSAGSTEITQNLSFNQPIQKPSDVSRALQKAARDLRKVK